jgi:hypothetical protein
MQKTLPVVIFLLLANTMSAWGQPGYDSVKDKVGSGRNGAIAPDAEAAEELETLRNSQRFWFRGEYMLGWIKTAKFPPLVTTGPANDPIPGALGSPNTAILFGRGGMDYQDRSGGRFTFGYWCDDDHLWGIEIGYLFLAGRNIGQAFTSQGEPTLAMPFFNTNKGIQDASLVTYPGLLNGSILIESPSFLQGVEGNVTRSLWTNEHFRFESLIGFRYLQLYEGLRIESTSRVDLAEQFQGLGIPFENTTITVRDRFDARSHFYGAQVGGRAEVSRKRFSLEFLGKVALGVSHQVVTASGFTGIDTQPATAANAGLYAVASNSGRFTRNDFAVAPELGATLKFRVTENVRIFAGYSFLYLSRVARPGDQLDPNINLNFVPTSNTFGAAGGPNLPALKIRSTDFFAHGASFGLEVRY